MLCWQVGPLDEGSFKDVEWCWDSLKLAGPVLWTTTPVLTPRHWRCRRFVGLPLATVPFRWLQRGGTVCHQRLLGLLLTWSFDIPKGDQVSLFSSLVRLPWRCPLWWSADVCVKLCNSFRYRFCNVPPQLCDGSTIILTFVVVVVVVVLPYHVT